MINTMTESPSKRSVPDAIRDAVSLMKSGRLEDAATLAHEICASHPASVDAHLLASQVQQRLGHFDAMLKMAEQASAIDEKNLNAKFRLLECLLYCGRADRVLDELASLEAGAKSDPRLLAQLAEYYAHCVDHEAARRCYRKASKLDPDNAEYLFGLASSEIAHGDMDTAERLLNRVIEIAPHDYDAYRNRATLRRQRHDDNHIDELLQRLKAGVQRPAGEVQLCFALAKEYEDLHEDDVAFDWLRRGADKRRSLLKYRVDGDLAVLARLQRVFDRTMMDRDVAGCADKGPVFVIGLPRSGTTLIDRILGSHSLVTSLGEINDFAYSLMHTLNTAGTKLELIDLSADIDFAALGRRYVQGTNNYRKTSPYLIDKTPLNYLYVGLIRLALPNARIVHIKRNPMDSCYGMYRTLFRAGYPFSYDLDDLGKYYIAYRELMDHWGAVAPDAFLDVSYEELVDNQETVSRRIIEYCELDWEPACLDFHKNSSAVATASSAQVRRPVYRDALQRWRRYEKQLQPLADQLRAAGIDILAD